MSESQIKWLAPAPFWPLAPQEATPPALGCPQLLRFASDSFMDEFMTLIEHEPWRLSELRALPETWRYPQVAPAPAQAEVAHVRALTGGPCVARRRVRARALAGSQASAGTARRMPLKLYQPGHQRFYLVSACLVCRTPGLPDRILDTGAEERVSFVVRRLRPTSALADQITPPDLKSCDEYALIGAGPDSRWEKIVPASMAAQQVAGEEQLPLFGVSFTDDMRHRRRILAGLVPVGRREGYLAAIERSQAEDSGATTALDAREAALRAQVIEPWKQLIYRIDMIRRRANQQDKPPITTEKDGPGPDEKSGQLKEAREQAQEISWYILLDFAEYLAAYLPDVWAQVRGEPPARTLSDAEDALITRLKGVTLSPDLQRALLAGSGYTNANLWGSLHAALAGIVGCQELDTVTAPYDREDAAARKAWPEQLFPLADPEYPEPLYDAGNPDDVAIPVDNADDPARPGLLQAIVAALQAVPAPARMPPLPLAARRALASTEPAWFVIRCLFERPGCGPMAPAIVSDPTEPFQLAGFFDPDAPARPIRIALPVDISPGGLRKFDKNTAFMISDMLCGQIDRLGKLTFGDLVLSVLPWPFHKDLPVAKAGPCNAKGSTFGMICSLSIPIITICALILLMIIVSLLDLIFHWIPYFILCFRLPGFQARPKR